MSNSMARDAFPLSQAQLDKFLNDGVLVVDDVLTADEIKVAREGLNRTLMHNGVDPENLHRTGHALKNLSSTHGSGGVLDIFYPGWKLNIATNPKLLAIVSQLWSVGYCSQQQDVSYSRYLTGDSHEKEDFRIHPYGEFDANHGYAYLDRIGYRIPTALAEMLGRNAKDDDCDSDSGIKDLNFQIDEVAEFPRQKRKRCRPIQRSLTPHLDCCPETIISNSSKNVSKWRPIQGFVSLTDSMDPNTGGFEAVLEFHRQFTHWAKHREPTRRVKKVGQKGGTHERKDSAGRDLCVGQYTPMRLIEDKEVLDRIQHIPCRAGSFVLWDYRIPHGNARRNDSNITRAVVYTSFLPDVELNRQYAAKQLSSYLHGQQPSDQWVEYDDKGAADGRFKFEYDSGYEFSHIGRKLMGIENWC